MPKRKITPELWAEVNDAYVRWNPSDSAAPTIDNLLRPFGISKQAFYAERRRQGLHTKADWRPDDTPLVVQAAVDPSVVETLLQMAIENRVRIQLLERELEEHRARVKELEGRQA